MELSLDEIIKKKKFGTKTTNGGGITKKFAQTQNKKPPIHKVRPATFKERRLPPSRPIIDARLKIVQNNRAKIIDARDKLIPKIRGDARRLIERRRTLSTKPIIRKIVNRIRNNGILEITSKPDYIPKPKPAPLPPRVRRLPNIAPRGYVDYDDMESKEREEYVLAHGLSRTVKNDYPIRVESYSPPRSHEPTSRRGVNSWGGPQAPDHQQFDPFEVYEVPAEYRERRMSPPPVPDIPPPPPPKSILRPSSRQFSPEPYARRYMPEVISHLSYEMRNRLENPPDPHASMGIFSNPLRRTPPKMPAHFSNGYRIVVSNLHHSVTQSDIKELFEDIGELYDSRLVRPGIAEVVYKNLDDAEKAVDTYHNRQLDQQPMKCLLVNPRASDKPTAPAIKNSSSNSRTAPGRTSLEIDIDALHKVLFRRH